MTLLYKWNASAPDTELLRTAQPEEIAAELNTLGVRYEQWPTQELADDADQEAVLAAYADEVARISAEENFVTVDVARLRNTGQPDFAETARAARENFFVEGSGTFYLHIDDTVYAVVCERGDLLSVPEGSTHWFDMGVADPQFCAIRFFHDGEGWVGDFTGEKISARFPGHDELLAGK